MPDQPRTPTARPIPLWVGLYATSLTTILFAGIYANAGETTRRGWFATLAAALELSGVVLVASPELRPRVETAIRWLRDSARRLGRGLMRQVRKLFGDRVTYVKLGTAVSTSAAMGIDVKPGFEDPPPAGASDAEKVEYLLRQGEQFKNLLNVLESQSRTQIGDLRRELERTASKLSKETSAAVRGLAESELRMRLLGVTCIVAGVGLSFAANMA